MKYIFHIPDLGPSRLFDTEEEAMMVRMTVADALALSPEAMTMEIDEEKNVDWGVPE